MQKIGFCERYRLTTAVLNRTKELTRRLEKALERAVTEYEKQHGEPFEIINQYWDEKRGKVCCLTKHGIIHVGTHYKLNEVVAVAQAYKDIFHPLDWVNREIYEKCKGWSNKLFVRADLMPHQIQITGVRIERLQDISDEDCLKEGIIKGYDEGSPVYWIALPTDIGWKEYRKRSNEVSRHIKGDLYSPFFKTPREAFAALINRPGVGRKGLWESNPWVVVYEFKLIK